MVQHWVEVQVMPDSDALLDYVFDEFGENDCNALCLATPACVAYTQDDTNECAPIQRNLYLKELEEI